MSDQAEDESALGYRQFTKACALLEDVIAKIHAALQSPSIIDWRVPELQLELARIYEALSRDEEAEAAYAAAAEAVKRVTDGPLSQEYVQFTLGEFYLRRRMFDRALAVSQLVLEGDRGSTPWMLLNIKAKA